MKTELEDALFFGVLMPSEPDLAKTPFAEPLFQHPARVRHRLAHRWTPPQHLLLTRPHLPLRLVRTGRGTLTGLASFADFANLDGFVQALELVGPMIEPLQGANPLDVFSL